MRPFLAGVSAAPGRRARVWTLKHARGRAAAAGSSRRSGSSRVEQRQQGGRQHAVAGGAAAAGLSGGSKAAGSSWAVVGRALDAPSTLMVC